MIVTKKEAGKKNMENRIQFPTVNFRQFYLKNIKIIIAFVIVVFLFFIGQILSPGFAGASHILMIIKTSAFLGILALAQCIVIIAGAEGIDLSVGAIASVGAVMASNIINGIDANICLALFIVTISGFILGFINGLGISYFKVPPLIMTLAMASVINGMIIIYSDGFAIKGSASELLKNVSGNASLGIPNIVLVWIIIIAISLVVLLRTKSGVSLYGVGANDMTAELSGVRTKKTRALAYAISGAISAIAGMFLLGYIGNAFMDIGSVYVLPSVAAVVIGGVSLAGGSGSYLGVVAGSIVLTTLTGILVTLKMGEAGKQVVFGLVLLILLALYGRQTKN
jgi:Ribose/xylose/arabinose/galactoside ABC-type transport systems, permease components